LERHRSEGPPLMKVIVVDNSALIPLFFEEEGTEAAQELFASAQYHCIAPNFLAIEFSNVLATGIRRKRITSTEASRHLRDFQSIGLEMRIFPTMRDLQHVLDVSEKTELSFYDALYLVLAQQEGALLATHDKKLRTRAEQEGVETHPL
jgi:predicted nucleic acid-binding protein